MTFSAFQEPVMQSLLEKIACDEGFKQPMFEIGLGSRPGDNFVGRIYRAVVTDSESSKYLSLIFKASPLSKLRQRMMSTNDTFQVETDVYQVVLPAFNKLLNKHGVASSNIFPGTARCLASHISEPDSKDCHVLVLEDKSVDGFKMFGGKTTVLDVEHCRLALKKVSLWHATSMALHHHDPETARKLEKLLRKDEVPLNNKNHPLFDELVSSAMLALKDSHEYCKIDDVAYKKTEELLRNYRNELVTVNQPSPDLFCIVQGDFWTNNLLFKYEKDGTIADACLLDFQFARVASPVTDIVYLLFLCTTKELRDAHYYELLRHYHSELCINLKKLNCDSEKIIPWQRFEEHLKRCGRIGVLAGLVCVPIFGAGDSDIQVNLHDCQQEGNVFAGCANITDLAKREEILRRLADVIEDSCKLGYI